MSLTKIIVALGISLLVCHSVSAQGPLAAQQKDTANFPYWITMMQDPDANFYATQSAFNKYWENRPITKGCGWKPFTRGLRSRK